jgi:hypothetical protein
VGRQGIVVLCQNGLVDIRTQVQHGILTDRRHQLEREEHNMEKMNLHGGQGNEYYYLGSDGGYNEQPTVQATHAQQAMGHSHNGRYAARFLQCICMQ